MLILCNLGTCMHMHMHCTRTHTRARTHPYLASLPRCGTHVRPGVLFTWNRCEHLLFNRWGNFGSGIWPTAMACHCVRPSSHCSSLPANLRVGTWIQYVIRCMHDDGAVSVLQSEVLLCCASNASRPRSIHHGWYTGVNVKSTNRPPVRNACFPYSRLLLFCPGVLLDNQDMQHARVMHALGRAL